MVIHTYNLSPQEAMTGGLKVRNQPEQYNKTLFHITTTKVGERLGNNPALYVLMLNFKRHLIMPHTQYQLCKGPTMWYSNIQQDYAKASKHIWEWWGGFWEQLSLRGQGRVEELCIGTFAVSMMLYFFLKNVPGTKEVMVQWGKDLLCKHEDQS